MEMKRRLEDASPTPVRLRGESGKRQKGRNFVLVIFYVSDCCAGVAEDPAETFTCVACMEEKPVGEGKMMSCCTSPARGGHGRNLCATECFTKWVNQDPHCPMCRKSWVDEIPRGQWIYRHARLRSCYDQQEEFLEARINSAERIITVRTTTLEMGAADQELRSLTVVEREVALCPVVYHDEDGVQHTQLEEVDVHAERRTLARRRARAEAALRREEAAERSAEERRLWVKAYQTQAASSSLQTIADAYKTARANFMACGTQKTLESLVAARNMLITARALGSRLDEPMTMTEVFAAQADTKEPVQLESVDDYPAAPGGPVEFTMYLDHYCKKMDLE